MIRNSKGSDIGAVVTIYNRILDSELAKAMTGWKKGVYPSYETASGAHHNKELFVMEDAGKIVAAAIINQKQVPEYAGGEWEYRVPDHEIMVPHTLVVDPGQSGKGYATKFVAFYESYAFGKQMRVPAHGHECKKHGSPQALQKFRLSGIRHRFLYL